MNCRSRKALKSDGFPKHDTCRKDICSAIDHFVEQLLRRRVAHPPLETCGLIKLAGCASHTKVNHLDVAIVGDKNVREAHITMHDGRRLLMKVPQLVSVVKTREHFADHLQPHFQRHKGRQIGAILQLRERLPIQILHHQEVATIYLIGFQGLYDVAVAQSASQLCFVQKELNDLFVLCEVSS